MTPIPCKECQVAHFHGYHFGTNITHISIALQLAVHCLFPNTICRMLHIQIDVYTLNELSQLTNTH